MTAISNRDKFDHWRCGLSVYHIVYPYHSEVAGLEVVIENETRVKNL